MEPSRDRGILQEFDEFLHGRRRRTWRLLLSNRIFRMRSKRQAQSQKEKYADAPPRTRGRETCTAQRMATTQKIEPTHYEERPCEGNSDLVINDVKRRCARTRIISCGWIERKPKERDMT